MNSFNKRGQLMTLFLIIGVAILIIVGFYLYMSGLVSEKNIRLDFDQSTVQGYIETCLKRTAEAGLITLGNQGGKIILQEYSVGPSFGTEIVFKNNQPSLPTIEDMQHSLNFYIDNNIDTCLQDFSDFETQGWTVEAGNIVSSTSINGKDVTVELSSPLLLSQQDNTLSFTSFTIILPIHLFEIHSHLKTMLSFMSSHEEDFDLSYLNTIGMNTTIFPYNDVLYVQLTDEQSRIQNNPYRFMIAVQ